MDAITPSPARVTPDTLAQIREMSKAMTARSIAARLLWPLARLRRIATEHVIDLIDDGPNAPQKRERSKGIRSNAPAIGEVRKPITFNLREIEHKAIRREITARKLGMSESIRRLIKFVDDKGLWDEALR